MKKTNFKKQVELLLEVLPYVAKESCFALKGGTAINLFVRDFPRLSVDIDLTYLGLENRDKALALTEKALLKIKTDIEAHLKPVTVISSSREKLPNDVKLFITKNNVQIKIEANPVIRDTLFPVKIETLVPKAVEEFGVEIDIQVVSISDLYGGKITAALDRQHPRDLFDIKLLFENEGITESVKEGFFVYLMSHKRPPHEVLKPTLNDMRSRFESEFEGMSKIPFTYQDFEKTRDKLISDINDMITSNDKKFLLSFFEGAPLWHLFPHEKVKNLPSIKWKLMNIEKMSTEKRSEQLKNLENIFQ